MYKEQVTELRSEMERVKDESKQVKEKYYAQVHEVYVLFEILLVVAWKYAVFWDMSLSSLVDMYQSFVRTCQC